MLAHLLSMTAAIACSGAPFAPEAEDGTLPGGPIGESPGPTAGVEDSLFLSVEPSEVEIAAGTIVQFEAHVQQSDGDAVPAEASWTATGGSVSPSGRYRAGRNRGRFRVVARVRHGPADTAVVHIKAPEELPDTTDSSPPDTPDDTPPDTTDNTPPDTPDDTPPDTTDNSPPDTPDDTPPDTTDNSPPDTPDDPPPDTTDTDDPEPDDPVPDNPTPDGTLIFADDFSSGNHHAWRNPDPGPGGNDPPDSFNPIDFTTTARSRSAPYAYAFFGIGADDPLVDEFNLQPIDRVSLKLLHWGPFDDLSGAYLFSAWYYWPSSYDLHGADNPYSNIMQWKGRGNPDFDPTWIVAVYGHSGEDRIVLQDWHGNMTGRSTYEPEMPVTVPKDRWFNLRALYVPDRQDGTIKVWLDGELIFSLEGVPTLGPDYTGPGPMWGVGNYGGDPVSSQGFYVDDVEVWRVEP